MYLCLMIEGSGSGTLQRPGARKVSFPIRPRFPDGVVSEAEVLESDQAVESSRAQVVTQHVVIQV
jgi:hypothetical protein